MRTQLAWAFVAVGLAGLASGELRLAAQASAGDGQAFITEVEQLRRDNPKLYQAVREGFTLFTEMLLGRLGYDIGPFDGILDGRTREAIRRYQRDRHLPENGDPFTFETVQAVRADDELLQSAPIGLQPKTIITDRWDRGFVSADGTWTAVSGDLASPEQTSNITCERAQAICREARATISGRGSARLLTVDLYTFEIELWNEREIVTKPLQFGCAATVHQWSRNPTSVTSVQRTNSDAGSCREVQRLENNLVLDDGNGVSQRLAEKQQEAWRRIVQISPATIRRLTEPETK
ncbi:MAG TPA: peptidoglycan-binding domain-containing protein [Vicinamibacterales bacterium]|nr:peptidoglycan-binding domain-containing protein [Vicinamibacterales bacterium]